MPNSLEHLQDAQLQMLRARSTSDMDAGELVRGWVLIARAARAVHDALPAPDPTRTVERIALMSTALASAGQAREWPGDGRPSAALEPVHAALIASTRATPPDSAVDVETAQRLLTAVLWIGAELVAERARDHGFDLAFHRVPDSAREQAVARDVSERLKAIETLALTGSLRPDTPADALGVALGRWDVLAHRALLTDRSTVTLHHVATLEVATFDAFRAATARAHSLGVIDYVTADRMDPAIAGAASAWRDVAKVAGDFSFGHALPGTDLLSIGDEVRGRFADLASPSSQPEDIDVFGSFTGHLVTSMALTAAARDLVDDRELMAPARAVNRQLRERVPRAGNLGSLVSAADLHQGRAITVPQAAREIIREPLDLAYTASAEAIQRSAALDPLYRSAPRDEKATIAPPARRAPVVATQHSSFQAPSR